MAPDLPLVNTPSARDAGPADGRAGAVLRLKSIEGHVRMIDEDDACCIDVINQIRAVQKALDRVAELTLKTHLDHCVVRAVQSDHPAARERVLAEVHALFRSA